MAEMAQKIAHRRTSQRPAAGGTSQRGGGNNSVRFSVAKNAGSKTKAWLRNIGDNDDPGSAEYHHTYHAPTTRLLPLTVTLRVTIDNIRGACYTARSPA